MKLSDAINLFINRPEIAPATRKSYYYDLTAMQDNLGPARLVSDIIPADLLRYTQTLHRKEDITSSYTYNKHITSIKAFFSFCVQFQIIEVSPAQNISHKRVDDRVPRSKAMPDSKLLKLLEYVKETPRGWNPREEALIRFLADTGVRIRSVATLTEDRLNLKDRSARVIMKNMNTLHTVRFGRECFYALTAWLLQREVEDPQRYVFSTDGHQMGADHLGQYFRRLCVRAGIGSWGPHSLRHRFGHKSAEKFPASIAAKMLGDTVEVFLRHYAPQDEEYIQRAMSEMSTDHILNSEIATIEDLQKRRVK